MGQIRRFQGLAGRAGHHGGSAAIEFGMVAPLFLVILLAFFDAGLLLTKSMMLDRALDKTVRLMRTDGAVRPKTVEEFQAKVCEGLFIFKQDCASSLVIEMTVVKTPASFPATDTPCISKNVPKPVAAYASGGRSDPVFVRACLSTVPLVPVVAEGSGFARNDLGRFNVISMSGFLNEPGAGDGK